MYKLPWHIEAFAQGTLGAAQPVVDLNFNLLPEGCLRVAHALESLDLAWLEIDLFDPAALAHVRQSTRIPICSGENLYGARAFRPFFEAVAPKGEGVYDTLKAIARGILTELKKGT